MGRKPDPLKSLPFPELWNEIRRYHKQQCWTARLRVAANLIGFWQFPVGWCWTEYKVLTEHDRTDYEKDAQQVSRCGLDPRRCESNDNEAQRGLEAQQNSVRAETRNKSGYFCEAYS